MLYYHVAGFGEWKSIFDEQYSLIKTSGLYDKCEEVRVGFLGQEGALDAYVEDKFKIVYSSENIQEYERPTINKLLSDAKKTNEEYYILYIHTKGCLGKTTSGIKGQYYWRQMMNYWMIRRHEDCIASLKVIFTVAPLASVVKVDGLITTLDTVGAVLSNVTPLKSGKFSEGEAINVVIDKPFQITVSNAYGVEGVYNNVAVDFITGADSLNVNTLFITNE